MPKVSKKDALIRKDVFIYTEIINCGQIGHIALKSFFAHHPGARVHVFGTSDDFSAVKGFPGVVFHALDKPKGSVEGWGLNIFANMKTRLRYKQIQKRFTHGHLGTASLWAYLIQTVQEPFMLHFDSDVVFRAPILGDIYDKIEKGYDLIGPVRNYKYNPHGDDEKRIRPDVTQTYCFAFNRSKVGIFPYKELVEMCRGGYNPLGFSVIDFFDPVGFDIQHNGGKLYKLPVNDFGGEDLRGGRKNKYPDANAIVDFGSKIAHFSGVGSGMNFFYHPDAAANVPESYVDHGLRRYAMYMKLFYNKEVMKTKDMDDYKPLFEVKKWF